MMAGVSASDDTLASLRTAHLQHPLRGVLLHDTRPLDAVASRLGPR